MNRECCINFFNWKNGIVQNFIPLNEPTFILKVVIATYAFSFPVQFAKGWNYWFVMKLFKLKNFCKPAAAFICYDRIWVFCCIFCNKNSIKATMSETINLSTATTFCGNLKYRVLEITVPPSAAQAKLEALNTKFYADDGNTNFTGLAVAAS